MSRVRRLTARDLSHPLERRAPETIDPVRIVARGPGIERGEQQVVRSEAGIDGVEASKTLHQQRRADQHRQGHRNLERHDAVVRGRTAACCAGVDPDALRSLRQPHLSGNEDRHERNDDPRQHRQDQSERHDTRARNRL